MKNKTNIVKNFNFEKYNEKYRNKTYKLIKISKKAVDDYQKRNPVVSNDYLLKGRKWALIGDTYYEIPKPIRWTWFRNLKTSVQVITSVLVGGTLVSAVVVPTVLILTEKFAYTLLEDGTYSVKAKKAFTVDTLTIPSSKRRRAVTVIENEGFNNCKINAVKIPKSIKKIGDKAFYSCGCTNVFVDNKPQTFTLNFNNCPVSGDNYVHTGSKCFGDIKLPEINTTDLKDGSQFEITFKGINELGDSIKYDIGHNDTVDYRTTGELPMNSSEYTTNLTSKVHGLLDGSKFAIYKNGNKVIDFYARKLGVTAPKYNFGLLTASYPVLLFSLKAKTFTEEGTIPTYIGLERYWTYDWNNLTYNMKHLPNISKNDALSNCMGYTNSMRKYIRELHELNEDSVFNLYCTDNRVEYYLKFITNNGIDDNHATFTILTDGSLTPVMFNKAFGIEEGQSKFDCNVKLAKMKKEIDDAKAAFFNKNSDSLPIEQYLTYQAPDTFAYVAGLYSIVFKMSYDKVTYFTGRLRSGENLYKVNSNDPDFCTKIMNSCTQEYTNNLLAALTPDEQANFKKMYKFSDDCFEESRKSGKKIITIMGGNWKSVEKPNFYAYLKMTMEYYGTDEYDYYYKGHPGCPTDLYPERKQVFDRLKSEGYKINELECSVAAEIILFYNPDIYASGWLTTTFESLQDDKGVAMYDKRLEDMTGPEAVYRDKFGCYFSVATNDDMNKYLGEIKNNVYLIQYNGNDGATEKSRDNFGKHDVALYLMNENKVRYWKNNYQETGNTVEVDVDGNPIG